MGACFSEFSVGLCLCQMRKGVGVMAPVMASMRRLYPAQTQKCRKDTNAGAAA